MQSSRLAAAFRGQPALAIVAAALISLSTTACAADRSLQYRFEVEDQPVAVSAHSEFNVKLTRTATGELVDDATITGSLLNMPMHRHGFKGSSPGGTRYEMWGEVRYIETSAPGLYRFMADVSMPGTWKLRLAAKVPGESETINGTVTFKAGD